MFKAPLLILLLIAGSGLPAQKPTLNFSHITVAHGLSHQKVNCITQDARGFIWIGTEDGLNRYDGRNFTIFRNVPGDTSTLSGNIITDLLEDKNGLLWIATADGGLTRYNYRLPARKQFKQFRHVEGKPATIPVNGINKLRQDKQGFLWLATSGASVLRFDPRKSMFIMPEKTGTKTVASLMLDEQGILWAGRIGGGLLKIHTRTLQTETDERYNNLYADLPHATITSIFRDRDGRVWFGSWDNVLYRYNPQKGSEEVFRKTRRPFSFPDDEIQSFAQDTQQRIWMGGKRAGLTIFDRNRGEFYNYKHDPAKRSTLADNSVNCVFIDRSGNIWLGTNKGLSVYRPEKQPFKQNFLTGNNEDLIIYDFFQYAKNELWIGTSKGIFIKQPDGGYLRRRLYYRGIPLSATQFFRDDDGTLFIGTQYSLFIYKPDKNNVILLKNTGRDRVMNRLIDSRIVSIVKDTLDGHPVLLVSPFGHYLTYYDFEEQRWISRLDSAGHIVSRFDIRDNLIRKFYKTRDGDLWLATVKFGLGEWQKPIRQTIRYHQTNPLQHATISKDNVYDIAEAGNGNLWVSTYGGGLNYYDRSTRHFSHIPASNNLLEGIATDALGNVWMVSNGNLQKYDPVTRKVHSWALPDEKNSGGISGYIFKDQENNFYVHGTNYYVRFDPLRVPEEATVSKIYFTDLKISDSSHSDKLYNGEISLEYNQNDLSIEFAAPYFGTDIRYWYQLEGLDKSWRDAGSRNIANYANLTSGHYVFRVKAETGSEGRDGIVATLPITIIAPFWERWWFYVLISATIISAAYLLYRYRLNEVLKRELMRNKIARDLHDNVGSALSSISVYGEVAKIYQERKEEEKLHHTLERITETSGEMIAEMSDIVWAIEPRNDHMATILQRMEAYARPLAQAKNIDFRFDADPALQQVNLDMEKRKNFFLIYKEAVNNALKYAACEILSVEIRLTHSQISLHIRDNGKGFVAGEVHERAAQSLAGNGLRNMQVRAADMNASLSIESAPDAGTAVILQFHIP